MKAWQKTFGDWIAQYKEGYWPDMRILAHMGEEYSEIAEELRKRADTDMQSAKLVGSAEFFVEIMQLGASARSFGAQNGKVSKTGPAKDSSLEEELADLLFSIICFANKHGIDLDTALENLKQKKLYGRDRERFERKEDAA